MDITMPQMEGIEAVERIVQEHPDARIVMVSSVGYQDNILAALQKGARHFVQKPVKPDALYEIIRYVLNDDGVTAPVGAGGELSMRMDLIQPFIGSLDSVLAEMMKVPAKIVDLDHGRRGLSPEGARGYRRFQGPNRGTHHSGHGTAAAAHVACYLADGEVDPSESLVPETVCELANMVIGNAVTQLNDADFHSRCFRRRVDRGTVRESRQRFRGQHRLLRNAQRQCPPEHFDAPPTCRRLTLRPYRVSR